MANPVYLAHGDTRKRISWMLSGSNDEFSFVSTMKSKELGKKSPLPQLIWDLWVALAEDWGIQENFQPCSEVGMHEKVQLRCCFCDSHALSKCLLKSKCRKSCLNGWKPGAVLVSSKSFSCIFTSLMNERNVIFAESSFLHKNGCILHQIINACEPCWAKITAKAWCLPFSVILP